MAFNDEEIAELIVEERKLPITHRSGYGGSRDDVASDSDGRPVYLPTPETPEDRF